MSEPDFGKPFDELTDDEIQQLSEHDWTAGQIMRAISMAIDLGDMGAVVQLMYRLAVKDPKSAAALLAVIEATA